MKITFKTLKQESFELEVDVETESVAELKQKFEKKCADFPADRQCLIYAGKIMEDHLPLTHYQLNEKHFIVVMNKKTKAPVSPAESSSTPSTSSSSSTMTTTTVIDDIQMDHNRIIELGFSAEETRIAMEVCDNDPNRAVEYLMAEIKDITPAHSSSNPLNFLREHPIFIEMKNVLQQNPNLLPEFLQRIQAANPDLMKRITDHPNDFLKIINEGTPQELDTRVDRDFGSTSSLAENLSPSDIEAIDRLKALGYPEHLVVQAYIACDRNEFLAADFLVSQSIDDDDQ